MITIATQLVVSTILTRVREVQAWMGIMAMDQAAEAWEEQRLVPQVLGETPATIARG